MRPLNVCMLACTHYDGDSRVMQYAEALVSRGDHVAVISLRRTDDEPDEVINHVKVIKPQTRARTELRRVDYLLRVATFLFRSASIITRKHRQRPYDLIHVHSIPDFLVVAAVLPKLTGARIILDIHDLLPEFYASKFHSTRDSFLFKLMLLLERASAQFADHVIIANDLWRDRLTARCVPENKCTSILNYPDRRIFRRNGKSRNDGSFVMLYPGTLARHQGVDIAIRALAAIRNEAPNAELHIYGEGPEREGLRELAHQLGLDRRVVMHDSVPLSAISGIMENANLGVVPKRGDSFGNEAFSTKIPEFMALGVPLIVADTAVDRYYFNDSLVRFFHCGDENDLAAAMLELINNPDLRNQLAQNGLEFTQRNDWETQKNAYLEIVDTLVSPSLLRTLPTARDSTHYRQLVAQDNHHDN